MAEITEELYEKFYKRFPAAMKIKDIEKELEDMPPEEAEEYDIILCNEIFNDFCWNRLIFAHADIEFITGSERYRIFKRRLHNLSGHIFYDAWCAFLEDRRKDMRFYIHEYLQTYVDEILPYGEPEIASGFLLAFKNAYKGFWKYVKQEIEEIPHDEIAVKLCDVIEAFYEASSNEEALEVLENAYQKNPECPTINELLGIVYFDGKKYGNSIAAFERLYVEETEDYNTLLYSQDEVCFVLGCANDKLKNRKAAISYYEKAIAIFPRCPYAANNLGYLYYREHQYEKAYAILKKCIDERWETDLVYPVTNFARVLYAMGKYNEAREFVKNAPVKIAKVVRDKINKAPKRDAEIAASNVISEDLEENAEPVIKAVIEHKGVQFQSEKVLEDELTMRLEAGVEVFGLPLKIFRRHGEYGRQYIFPRGRLDILAEDPDGNLYIIELKKDSGYDDAYRQIVEYIEWFQKHKARGKRVYGIICLNAPGKALLDAVRKDERVKLYEYQISYREVK